MNASNIRGMKGSERIWVQIEDEDTGPLWVSACAADVRRGLRMGVEVPFVPLPERCPIFGVDPKHLISA